MNRRSFLAHAGGALLGMGFVGPVAEILASRRSPDGRQTHPDTASRVAPAAKRNGRSAIVIGGGVAGLMAAHSLAWQGWDVDLFEKRPTYGGFCSTLSIDSFNFDLGPHVFTRQILEVMALEPGDLEPAAFAESFLIDGRLKRFPSDLVREGYVVDMLGVLLRSTFSFGNRKHASVADAAYAAYGPRATDDIFRPLIEKWCRRPLEDLDARYFASRMHSSLEPEWVWYHLKRTWGSLWSAPAQSSGGAAAKTQAPGIPWADAYSGSDGAQVIPRRLAASNPNVRTHTGTPVTGLDVNRGRIATVVTTAGEFRPDAVVSTLPLDRLAAITSGDHRLDGLSELTYLDILFVFVRIERPHLTRSKWIWVPGASTPFYRMSEMKALNERHAPPHATGICLEVTFRPNDPRRDDSDELWKRRAFDFLSQVFSVSKREIIGMDVVRRPYAYPSFTRSNAKIVGRYLKAPFKEGESAHEFDLGIDNVALAGRAGTFVYLLTPEAIFSGYQAAIATVEAAGDSWKSFSGSEEVSSIQPPLLSPARFVS